MEQRRFSKLPREDRLALLDILYQLGFTDSKGFVTEAGEHYLRGEEYPALGVPFEALDTNIKPGYVRLTFRLPSWWPVIYTKAEEVRGALGAAEFNTDIVATASVFIYDRDVHAEDEFLSGDIQKLEEVPS